MSKIATARLDQLIVDRGLAESRAKAQALILAARVSIAGKENLKAGMLVARDVEIVVTAAPRWVGRGGEKLAGALDDFGLTQRLDGVWLDCGASTGGFTDVLLANGVKKVYAVDVGYGQLALSLRNDSRVVVIERFNIRNLSTREVPDALDGVTLDLSFISSRLVLPVLRPFLKGHAPILLLFKPQFEGEKKDVGKGGIIRDEAIRKRIVETFESWAAVNRWTIKKRTISPIKGQGGNVEYFFQLAEYLEQS